MLYSRGCESGIALQPEPHAAKEDPRMYLEALPKRAVSVEGHALGHNEVAGEYETVGTMESLTVVL